VIDVSDQPHPALGKCMAVIIESDGLDEWQEGLLTEREWENLDNEENYRNYKKCRYCRSGRGRLSTYVKLNPPKDAPIDTLIINAAECEPFLTADHRIMLEYTERVVTGILILKKILAVIM
jgi:electron transport complex protein RnfC